ncbi:LPPG domain containing protein [Methanococcus aeolicus Nankai-3]|uniref:2-phospho-L-lactate transferase n=1 Tax=Methanococcus aeolicus (strain ATCC BAA-1280 / DSM 17508 / OCM 812 / Nankai-3) TaxID=419665 RepID=A6UV80_META3|nr:2-phospho-L-lactate transferase [Methanococcus aeolicus]ABR56402.1 LPPG domain containing protein [Methanococcus aeolicus Nankai-3]
MKVCILSGGTGAPKLIQGLKEILPEEDISVIVNTGEDTMVGDLYLSPDVDTVLYTLSNQINEDTWYGVKGDTFIAHNTIKEFENKENNTFGENLRIGDKDRALKMHKTHYINKGYPLSKIIKMEKELFGIKANIFPMTDDIVRTKILINENNNKYLIDFHDFWINRRGNATVVDIFYENSNYAGAPSKTIECIKNSDIIIIGPSNPITSIAPILSIKDIKDTIIESNKPVVAVSPIIGEGAVSGPAGILMKAKGYPVSAEGVCKFYNDLGININTMILDNIDKNKDFELKVNSCDSNTAVAYTNTIMKTIEDKINLAKFIVNLRTI